MEIARTVTWANDDPNDGLLGVHQCGLCSSVIAGSPKEGGLAAFGEMFLSLLITAKAKTAIAHLVGTRVIR